MGTDAKHRGHCVMNGLVILHRHFGQTRISRWSCSSSEETTEEADSGGIMPVVKLIFERHIRR